MSLYGNRRRNSALNTSTSGNDVIASHGTDTPYRYSGTIPQSDIKFVSAIPPLVENKNAITKALEYVSEEGTLLPGGCHKTINSGYYAPIYLGTAGEPDPEFFYAKPLLADATDSIFGSTADQSNCEKVFFFANIQGTNLPPCQMPNSGFPVDQPVGTNISIKQNCEAKIYVNSPCVKVINCGTGLSFHHSTKEIDTWLNGQFSKYANGSNVGPGTGNWQSIDPNSGLVKTIVDTIPERYTWQYGSIFLFKGLGFNPSTRNVSLNKNDYLDPYISEGSRMSPTCMPQICLTGDEIIETVYGSNINVNGFVYNYPPTPPACEELNASDKHAKAAIASFYRTWTSIVVKPDDGILTIKTWVYDVEGNASPTFAELGVSTLSPDISGNTIPCSANSLCITICDITRNNDKGWWKY